MYERPSKTTRAEIKRSCNLLIKTKLLFSPAEIQDDLAIASIEIVFVYSDRYGHSDLKSD